MADDKKSIFPWNKAKENKSRRTECVYAGPEYFEGKQKDANMMEDVYAGPEFFEQKADNEVIMEGVYAGPENINVQPDMFMCAYAGPEFPANQQFGINIVNTQSEQPTKPAEPTGDGQIICPCCGSRINAGKFCPECGTPLPTEEQAK